VAVLIDSCDHWVFRSRDIMAIWGESKQVRYAQELSGNGRDH